MSNPDLTVEIGDLKLKNPLTTASGTSGYGQEVKDYYDPEILGALTVKGLTVEPSGGNPVPRIVETPAGILNSIGLENPGLNEFKAKEVERLGEFELPVIVNISGHSVEDYLILARQLATCDQISALEVNVSCPNIEGGGMAFGTNAEQVYRITRKIKEVYSQTVIVKLTPNVTDITEVALAAEEAGSDSISLINTLQGMAIDIHRQEPVLGNIFGGLSGPAVKPVALSMVYKAAGAVDIPVIGMGGIMSGADALEFIMAGASAVAVGTGAMVNPELMPKIIAEIENYLTENRIKRVQDIIGIAQKKGGK
ncbi:MAG: dihydroorotate dehydrogenase [Halanaerobiaceae bacterium]